MPKLSSKERRAFAVGNGFLNRNWVSAPASTAARDGVGPIFQRPVLLLLSIRGRPRATADTARVPELGLLRCLSIADCDGRPRPVAFYGGRLQDRAINGVLAQGKIRTTKSVAGNQGLRG